MALSFKEKRELQRIVAEKQQQLSEGSLPFKAKREAQKAMADALERLNQKVDAGGTSPLLSALLNGDYNKLPPIQFLQKLREVVDSIGGEIDPVKPGAVKYVEYQIESGNIILESLSEEELLAAILEDAPRDKGAILEAAKPKNPSVPKADQRKINDILHEYGKQRWRNIPLDEILGKIVALGYVPLQEDGTEWDGLFTGATGKADLPIAAKQQRHNGLTQYDESSWYKQYLHFQWYRDKASDEKSYELNAYLM